MLRLPPTAKPVTKTASVRHTQLYTNLVVDVTVEGDDPVVALSCSVLINTRSLATLADSLSLRLRNSSEKCLYVEAGGHSAMMYLRLYTRVCC